MTVVKNAAQLINHEILGSWKGKMIISDCIANTHMFLACIGLLRKKREEIDWGPIGIIHNAYKF